MAKNKWWEEEDKFGYTYADTERPGYMAQPPVEEDVVSEEALEYSKLREPGGYEDPEGGDIYGISDEELTQYQEIDDKIPDEALKMAKLKSPGGYEDPEGGDIVEKEEVEVEKAGEPDVASQKEIRKLMGLASKAKGAKKADAYADVIEALDAYEGKDTAYLKGLRKKFSNKASVTRKSSDLGDYRDYLSQGRSWKPSTQDQPAPQPQPESDQAPLDDDEVMIDGERIWMDAEQKRMIKQFKQLEQGKGQPEGYNPDDPDQDHQRMFNTDHNRNEGDEGWTGDKVVQKGTYGENDPPNLWKSDKGYNQGAIASGASRLKDGRYLRGQAEHVNVFLNGKQWKVTENHLAKKPRNVSLRGQPDHGHKRSWVLLNGKIVEHVGDRYNHGVDINPINHSDGSKRYAKNDDGTFKLHNGKKYQEIPSMIEGTITRIDEKKNGAYPTGWGRLMEVRTNKFITIGGEKYPLYVHYGHATPDSYKNLKVGQDLGVGQVIGKVGGTGKRNDNAYPSHLDMRGYVWVKDKKSGKVKRVVVSPSEWLPLVSPPQEEPETQRFQEGGEVYEDSWMKEQVSDAVPQDLQSVPQDSWMKQKDDGISDLVSGLDEVSAQAGQEELQKADEIIQEDVGDEWSAFRSGEAESFEEEDTDMAAFRSGEAESFKEQSTPQDSWMEEQVEKTEQEKIGRDPFLSETALTRTKDGIPGYIMAGDMEGLIRARDSKKFKPSVIEREIARRKKLIQKQAGLKRPPKIKDIIRIEKTKQTKAPKVPKGDVSKREPDVKIVSDAEKKKDSLQRQREEIDAKIKDYQKMESKYEAIDNKRFFNQGGTLNKIISLVAAGFGGYASGRYGGPNVYLNLIDKAVKEDIGQQKLDREDEVAKQNAAYKKIQQLTERYKMASQDDFQRKKLDMLQKRLDQKINANRVKAAKSVIEAQEYQKIGRPLSRAEFIKFDRKYKDMKLRDRALTGRDGKVYIVDNVDAKKKLEEQIENNTGAIQAIDQLIVMTPKLDFWKRLPGAGKVSVNRRIADATRDALVGKLRLELFGPGVMTDTEREQAKKIIGDPGALFEMDAPKLAALQNIRWKLRYAERERLRRNGVQIGMTPNDLKVEHRLKRMGHPSFMKAGPGQKREAMDYLIKREKEAMAAAAAGNPPKGWYKGKFWDKDEQGQF
tara:strand:- start:429 stop:3911 length:3483 start_codon:yes stop_codon:yes gene_type:complete